MFKIWLSILLGFIFLNVIESTNFVNYLTHSETLNVCHTIRNEDRIDCNPDQPITKEVCEKRGCCWNPVNQEFSDSTLNQMKALPVLQVPYCYYGTNYVGYKIVANSSKASHINLYLKRVRPSGFLHDIQSVSVDIYELNDETVRIKFIDSEKSRYEVPVPHLNLPSSSASKSKLYSIELDSSNLIIRRRETGQAIFNVNLALLVYSDQFIQITTRLPSDFIYGLGEHREPFRKPTNWKRYTMFNRDQYPLPDMALYGSHPFYLTVEEYSNTKPASGVFLFNSNAMDIITQPQPAITFRTIGGILDFFIFFGPEPEKVVAQYHKLIGLPIMPPFWALGFHLSRFGYQNFSNLNATFTRTKNAEIPLDVQWTDIDMMDSNNDFTYDKKRFKELPEFIEKVLHKNGMKFIPMFDCGISGQENLYTYSPYELGLEMDVFIKNSSNQVFYGKVWNDKSTVWPDFFHPNATLYWTKLFVEYRKKIPFDGAWIDMNEPSNFFDGQNNGCPQSKLEDPRYTPGMTDDHLTLRHKTLCMTARHYNGSLHYNLHNLYGFQQAIVTNAALKKTLNKRPFIISRSSAPGHGYYAYHWNGDIVSDWPSMKWSISSILNFNIFGIPMVGADICGFNGNTSEELCARWHQLGAFYTFARNHNTDNTIDQDPVALGENVVIAARSSLLVRYTFLSYLYTLFYQVHKNGGTVLRPLFFEFPYDQNAYKIDSQFMWGSSIMIAPALYPKQTQINIYFPEGSWFSLEYRQINSHGQFILMPAPFNYTSVFIRSGSIIPTQKPKLTTEALRKENFTLLVALENETSKATGHLYLDCGDCLDTEHSGLFNLYDFQVKNNTLTIKSKHLRYETELIIDMITIMGFSKTPHSISVNGNKDGFSYKYNQSDHILIIHDVHLALFNHSSLSHDVPPKIYHDIHWNIE